MPSPALLVLAIVVLAMVMFAVERIPLEVASLVLIVALALSGILTPEEAFAGISNGTVIFIFALLAMTQGLASTGVMQIVGRRASFVRNVGERTFLATLMATVAAFSSLASNTAVTAAFLPVASASAARAHIPRSRVLMPMAYSSMLGGMIFLFGSSTNLVVSEAMQGMGMAPIGFAELTAAGLPVAAIGIVLIVLSSRFLLRERDGSRTDPPLDHREFVTEAALAPRSRFLGRTLEEIASELDIEIIGLIRAGSWHPAHSDIPVGPDDRLVVRGGRREILRIKDLRSVVLGAELAFPPEANVLEPRVLAEAFVPPHSPLVGRTLDEFLFVKRLGLLPLAIHRHPGVHLGEHPADQVRSVAGIRLAPGDVLLISGRPSRLRELSRGELLVVLGGVAYRRPRYRKAILAVAIFAASLVAAATGAMPAAIAGLLGLLAMLATRCMPVGEAFRIEWRVVLLIGALLALGQAMEKSGAGGLVAEALIPLARSIGAHGILFVIMLLTVALSAPMSNQAAALVVLPVAVHLAQQLGVAPRPFAIATCLAASCSFVTPLEPSAALVYGPGHYRFSDFIRVGTPLTLLLLIVLTLLVPMIWAF